MAYVVTQACCADASCVVACPVNCIHPAPGEPGFAEAEMLYVDPNSCVGCGACATACPVDAIKPQHALTAAERPFSVLNAAYYEEFSHADRAPLAVVAQTTPTRRAPTGTRGRGGRRPGGAVRRRRAAAAPRGDGRRLRPAAHAVRTAARRRRPRPPAHQAGGQAVPGDRGAARVPLPARRRGRPRRHADRAGRSTTTRW